MTIKQILTEKIARSEMTLAEAATWWADMGDISCERARQELLK